MLNTKEEIYYTVIIVTVFFLLLIGIIITTSILYYSRKKIHLSEKAKFAQTLLQSQLEIKEQTLQHLAYEMHDNLGQIASLIKINLTTLQLNDKEGTRQKIEHTKELVRQWIADLKALSLSLNSERVTQLGMAKGLENEVERINKTGQFKATLSQYGQIPMLDANTTVILYRMTQEILNNIIKHSGGELINISMQAIGNLFILVCNDNGVGFNVETKSGGSGLLNLQNRAKLINAKLTIQSSPEEGTTVSIEIPI